MGVNLQRAWEAIAWARGPAMAADSLTFFDVGAVLANEADSGEDVHRSGKRRAVSKRKSNSGKGSGGIMGERTTQ
jgi:hypothetical protein